MNLTSEHEAIDVDLDDLLNLHFAGHIVRKDLTKLFKKDVNLPAYVLEYLLGNYFALNDRSITNDGVGAISRALEVNYVRPSEEEQVKSKIRELGQLEIIDKVNVSLNDKRDIYEAHLSSLDIKGVDISPVIVDQHKRLQAGGAWSIVTIRYLSEDDQNGSAFIVEDLNPIQMHNFDIRDLLEVRQYFTENQWIDVLLRSVGYEPTQFKDRVKLHLLNRMVPLVENNYALCELGTCGTGKNHMYFDISPNSILVSGGQATVSKVFYNQARCTVGMVGSWDVVAFDEADNFEFKSRDGIHILKDYMANGAFSQGLEPIKSTASMVFIGNINSPVNTLAENSHLFVSFPEAMIDSAFFDRFHSFIPGWEIPKMRSEFFTDQYGLSVVYLAEFFHEMRKRSFADAIDEYFELGSDINRRDTIAIKKTVSGLLKLLQPNGEHRKEVVQRCLEYALENRWRIKEQLKKISGKDFFNVNFSYIDNISKKEIFISADELREC